MLRCFWEEDQNKSACNALPGAMKRLQQTRKINENQCLKKIERR